MWGPRASTFALAVAVLFGCDRGSTTTTTTPPAAEHTPASTPATVTPSLAIEVTNVCSVEKGIVILRALVASTTTAGKDKGKVEREVWDVSCSQPEIPCTGTLLELDRLEKTRKLGFNDLRSLGNVRLQSVTAAVAVIKWGSYFTLTVDTGKKHVVVEYRGGPDDQAIGEADCSTDLAAAMLSK